MMYIDSYIINKVKTFRKEKNFTQDDFAQILNMSRTSYNNIEQERQKINYEKLYILACVLNIGIENFYPKVAKLKLEVKEKYVKKKVVKEQTRKVRIIKPLVNKSIGYFKV